MAEVVVKQTIHVSPEAVWETLRKFGDLEEFLPMVASCRLEGSGVGAKRTLVTRDGAEILEELVALDDQERTLRYKILDSPLPFDDYLATVRVRSIDNHHSEIDWSSTFQPEGAPEADAVEMVRGIYAAAINGLEQLLSR
jgi:hypothetical protein